MFILGFRVSTAGMGGGVGLICNSGSPDPINYLKVVRSYQACISTSTRTCAEVVGRVLSDENGDQCCKLAKYVQQKCAYLLDHHGGSVPHAFLVSALCFEAL